MALKFAVQTILEIIVVVLIIYGFIHEDKLIAFEERITSKIKSRKEEPQWANISAQRYAISADIYAECQAECLTARTGTAWLVTTLFGRISSAR